MLGSSSARSASTSTCRRLEPLQPTRLRAPIGAVAVTTEGVALRLHIDLGLTAPNRVRLTTRKRRPALCTAAGMCEWDSHVRTFRIEVKLRSVCNLRGKDQHGRRALLKGAA